MKLSRILHFCVYLSVSTTVAFGQWPTVLPGTPETNKTLQDIEKKSLLRLDETIDEAQSLRLPENRIYVFYSAADLLWPRDEKRARQLFERAADEISAVSNQSKEGGDELPEDFLALQVIRNQFLDIVGIHDAELAIELVRRTRPIILNQALNAPPADVRNYYELLPFIQTENALEKNFAVLMIRQNPQRALEIARVNLRRGASSNDLHLIDELKTKDFELASQFANEVLQKIVSTDFSRADSNNTRNLAASFLTEFALPQPVAANSSGKPKQLQINEPALHRLAEKYADYFLSDASKFSYDYEIQDALPLFEKILPERVAGLRQKYGKANPTKEKLNQLTANATPERMIAEAPNFPAQMRPQIYNSAAGKAAKESSYEEARRLLNALPDQQNRERALLKLDQQTFKNDLDQGKYAEAEQIIQLQTGSTQKIVFLVQIARHFYDKGQNEKALREISQAYTRINPKPENNRELSDLIEVLSVSPEISPEKTFDLVESFLPTFNEILAANALPGQNQQCNCTFRRGEFVLSTINKGFYVDGGKTEGIYVGLYDLRFMFLARVDLEHAMSLADQIERRDVQLATRLLILHSILYGGKVNAYQR